LKFSHFLSFRARAFTQSRKSFFPKGATLGASGSFWELYHEFLMLDAPFLFHVFFFVLVGLIFNLTDDVLYFAIRLEEYIPIRKPTSPSTAMMTTSRASPAPSASPASPASSSTSAPTDEGVSTKNAGKIFFLLFAPYEVNSNDFERH
jgi:hypothetical protein